jgi:hypothetical protein
METQKITKVPTLVEQNPILIWLYEHGWESPDWGQSARGQLVHALIIHDAASKITDTEARKAIQSTTAKILEKATKKIVEESS